MQAPSIATGEAAAIVRRITVLNGTCLRMRSNGSCWHVRAMRSVAGSTRHIRAGWCLYVERTIFSGGMHSSVRGTGSIDDQAHAQQESNGQRPHFLSIVRAMATLL